MNLSYNEYAAFSLDASHQVAAAAAAAKKHQAKDPAAPPRSPSPSVSGRDFSYSQIKM